MKDIFQKLFELFAAFIGQRLHRSRQYPSKFTQDHLFWPEATGWRRVGARKAPEPRRGRAIGAPQMRGKQFIGKIGGSRHEGIGSERSEKTLRYQHIGR
jgi:hypothetical protein